MTRKRQIDAVVAGHICLDVIPDLTHVKLDSPGAFYTPGKLMNARPATISTGGPVSNTGLALVKMGMNAVLMGKVGADPFGQVVRMLLQEQWGVTEGLIVDPATTTSYSLVIAPAGFDRMFIHSPGANNTFCADDVDYNLVATARHFHMGYPPLMASMYADEGKQLIEVFRRVHELGVTTSLDMSLPDPASPSGQVNWAGVLAKLLPFVDIYVPSVEETTFMLDRPHFDDYRARAAGDMLKLFTGDDLHDLSDRLLGLGGKICGIKCGYRGFYVRSAGPDVLAKIGRAKPAGGKAGAWEKFAHREFWQPTYHIDQYGSATGSGDSAIAGFLAAYLRGLSLDDVLRYATACGALNVSKFDALSGLKDWDALTADLKAGWKTDPITVTGHGWRPDEFGRWIGPADKS